MLKNFLKFSTLIAASLLSFASYGLADADAPTKIQIPFANSAGGAYIRTVPVASQIGIQNGAASYTDGFPPLNFTPINAGGVPPFGQDMNGIMRDVSAHARWWAAGGPVYYDSTYQTAIGGYPKGAVIQSATVFGKLWYSSTENNLTNPDTGGAGWSTIMDTIYAPLTGTGASGTWGISISGNAATATTATTATTQTTGDNSTKIATTAFVQNTNSSQSTYDVTASRTLNLGYANNTLKTIYVMVRAHTNASLSHLYAHSGGALVAQQTIPVASSVVSICFSVAPGESYDVGVGANTIVDTWAETY